MTDNKASVIFLNGTQSAIFYWITTGYNTGYVQVVHKIDEKISRFFPSCVN